ncbi:hypothetical protein JMN32_23455 [Fulvivirga sp. 29W222]|uniref:Uncharacterized protein n=1 Tax=Fulvivirga marina TaxID=2494733 RepID=A0A937G252_9BACT|nr:hypothetical protein [Fulvivirga marina]MBL6449287.1 hypothetical protein [Fulvivirga marina]
MRIYYLVDDQFIVTSEATEIQAILGSCISICLSHVAGMNHYRPLVLLELKIKILINDIFLLTHYW